MELKEIAVIHTDFPEKFGIPRQSGLVGGLQGTIVFSPEYRNADAIRGLNDFSHLWLVWGFSKAKKDHWSATVRPPRLGGKVRMGIFATRSPFRPNPIGLSSVKLESVTMDEKLGPIITVSGIDMLDGTPIYDIKPYLPHIDSHPEATGGFALSVSSEQLEVIFQTICCKRSRKLTGNCCQSFYPRIQETGSSTTTAASGGSPMEITTSAFRYTTTCSPYQRLQDYKYFSSNSLAVIGLPK